MGKGGSESESKSVTKLPEWYVKYAKDALALSNKVAQTGYTPFMGHDVAAFTPQGVRGMQGAQDFSDAFAGKNAARTPSVASTLPRATTDAQGFTGYSSYPGYQENMRKFKAARPGQYDYIKGFSIDPRTGKLAPKYRDIMKTDRDDPLGPIYNPAYRPNPGQQNGNYRPQYAFPRYTHNEHQ